MRIERQSARHARVQNAYRLNQRHVCHRIMPILWPQWVHLFMLSVRFWRPETRHKAIVDEQYAFVTKLRWHIWVGLVDRVIGD